MEQITKAQQERVEAALYALTDDEFHPIAVPASWNGRNVVVVGVSEQDPDSTPEPMFIPMFVLIEDDMAAEIMTEGFTPVLDDEDEEGEVTDVHRSTG